MRKRHSQKRSGTGKTAIVTGASQGIGAALSLEMAARGYNVVLAARTTEALNGIAHQCQQLGVQTLICTTDIAVDELCRELIASAIERFGTIDILINNAGISMRSAVADTTDLSSYERIMRVNYLGAVACTTFALPHLIASQGVLVAVSSLQGLLPFSTYAGYAASKHAVQGFFESLRTEIRDEGVTVLVASPGPVATNIHENRLTQGERIETSSAPAQHEMTPERCAALIARAIDRRYDRLVMTASGRLAVAIRPIAPTTVDRLITRSIRRFWLDP